MARNVISNSRRILFFLTICALAASSAWAQAVPPQPPGSDEGTPPRSEETQPADRTPDRDNPAAEATKSSDDPPTDRQHESSRGQPGREDAPREGRSAFDNPQDFRDATRDTERDARSQTDRRQQDFDRSRDASQRDRQFDQRDQFDRREFDRRDEFDRRGQLDQREDFSRDQQSSRDSRDSRFSAESRTSAEFRTQDIRSADIGLWFDRSTNEGLVINDLGSGAISRLGFREGDRIYSVNGIRVDREADFVNYLFDERWRAQRVPVIIYRHGRPWTVFVQPSVLVQEYTTVAYDPLDDWGLVLDDRYDDYVVVWRVLPRSPAFYAGFRPGDVITTFQGQRLVGRDSFVQLVQRGGLDMVDLDINRNRQTRRLSMDLSSINVRSGARTSLRPDFDGGADINVRSGTGVRSDATIRGGAATIDPQGDVDVRSEIRTGSRFNSTIDGRLEGTPDGRLDRTNSRSMFPSNAPSGAPTPGTGTRGTIDVPGVQGGVRVQGSTRGGIFGGRRP